MPYFYQDCVGNACCKGGMLCKMLVISGHSFMGWHRKIVSALKHGEYNREMTISRIVISGLNTLSQHYLAHSFLLACSKKATHTKCVTSAPGSEWLLAIPCRNSHTDMCPKEQHNWKDYGA